jgi:hypothetical protein
MFSLIRITPKEYKNLLRGDHSSRVQFCEWLQPPIQMLSDILFTDQSHFTRDGINNTRCTRPRPQQNPLGVVQSNFR